jgi:hypothetical protein
LAGIFFGYGVLICVSIGLAAESHVCSQLPVHKIMQTCSDVCIVVEASSFLFNLGYIDVLARNGNAGIGFICGFQIVFGLVLTLASYLNLE